MLSGCADDDRAAGILEESKGVPEAEGGLHRSGIKAEVACLGIRAPSPRLQGAELVAAAPPTLMPDSLRSKSQNGWLTRTVSQSMMPVSWPLSASSWPS
jgi:hypothetical protein